MKRMLVAVSLAVLAAPAFAQYLHGNSDEGRDRHWASEKTQPDRAASSQTGSRGSAAAGSTSAATGGSGWATGVWANDHNFIAPAQ